MAILLACCPLAHADRLTVFAAASLKDAFDEVIRVYEQRTGDKIVASYAASAALARQIEAGAPADIFISADLDWMDYLDKRKLIRSGTRRDLLRNRIVLIAPATSGAAMKIAAGFPLASALGNGRLSMADPESVPAGKYGKAALQTLGIWKDVQSRVVPAQDVRGALMFVARGETPFGIVYRTDAMAEKNVRIIDEFPAASHPPIIYPAALVATSIASAATAFLNSLSQLAARTIFDKHGFR